MENSKSKKIVNIVSNVLLYLFLAVCILTLGLTIFAPKDDDGTAIIFGHQMRVVITESMEKSELTDVSDFEIKSIPKNSMVFVEIVPEDEAEAKAWYDDLNVGDVLTFKYVYSQQVTITHRIVDIQEKGDGYIITLEGDNKSSEDSQGQQIIDTTNSSSFNYVVGKVVGQSFIIGLIFSIMKSPIGLIFVIIVPCAIVIIMEIIKIVSVVNGEKQQKVDEGNKKKDDELEELRKRLAMLENMAIGGQNAPPAPAPTPDTSAPECEKTLVAATEEQTESKEDSREPEETKEDVADEPVEEDVAEPVAETEEKAEDTTDKEEIPAEENAEVKDDETVTEPTDDTEATDVSESDEAEKEETDEEDDATDEAAESAEEASLSNEEDTSLPEDESEEENTEENE